MCRRTRTRRSAQEVQCGTHARPWRNARRHTCRCRCSGPARRSRSVLHAQAAVAAGGANFQRQQLHVGGPKAAKVGSISGLKLRKWRALARQDRRRRAPARRLKGAPYY